MQNELTIEEKIELYNAISKIFDGEPFPEEDESIVLDDTFFEPYVESAKTFFYEGSTYAYNSGCGPQKYDLPEAALADVYPEEYEILKKLEFFRQTTRLFRVVGTNDLEGVTFATCTTYEKAQQAAALIGANGFKNMIDIVQDRLPVDAIGIGGKIIYL